MTDFTKMSDEELLKQLSDEELMQLIKSEAQPQDIGVATMEEPTEQSQQSQGMEKQNILGWIFNVPGAAIRSGLQGKGFAEGAINPSSVPKFQDIALDKYYGSKTSDIAGKGTGMLIKALINRASGQNIPADFTQQGKTLVGNVPSAIGMIADQVTNPAEVLLALLPKLPIGSGKNLGDIVSSTKQAKELEKFLTKERYSSDIINPIKKMFKYDNTLKQAEKAKVALDTVRDTLGKAKSLAIQEVADAPTNLNMGLIKTDKITKAISNPIYEVEFNSDGSIKQTIGNLDKVKEAVGELIHTDKIWEEAPNKELRMVKLFYKEITSNMRKSASSVGKPIDKVLDDYGTFMDNYRLVNKTLTDSAGQVYANKLKTAFKFGAEDAYKKAWGNIAKQSPEIRSVMNSMNKREMLKNLLKLGGISAGGTTALKMFKQ